VCAAIQPTPRRSPTKKSYAEKAVKALELKNNTTFAKELDLERLVPALNFGINARSAVAKKAAKSVCQSLAASMSVAGYEELVSGTLGLTPLQVGDDVPNGLLEEGGVVFERSSCVFLHIFFWARCSRDQLALSPPAGVRWRT
jgi:hypothetical protein